MAGGEEPSGLHAPLKCVLSLTAPTSYQPHLSLIFDPFRFLEDRVYLDNILMRSRDSAPGFFVGLFPHQLLDNDHGLIGFALRLGNYAEPPIVL